MGKVDYERLSRSFCSNVTVCMNILATALGNINTRSRREVNTRFLLGLLQSHHPVSKWWWNVLTLAIMKPLTVTELGKLLQSSQAGKQVWSDKLQLGAQVNDLKKGQNNLLLSHQFGFIVLMTSADIRDQEEARWKHAGGKILRFFF